MWKMNAVETLLNPTSEFTNRQPVAEKSAPRNVGQQAGGRFVAFGVWPLSITLMSAVWRIHCNTPAEKLVLLALADNANDDGACWPSRSTIARKTGLSEQGVRNQVESLSKSKLITVEPRFDKAGDRTSNIYRLNLPGGQQICPPPQASCPQVGKLVAHGGQLGGPRVGNAVAPDPSVEPSRNHQPNRISDVAALISEIGTTVYGRKENQRPSRMEEEAALQIVQRPDWRLEMEEILVFNRIVAPADRKFQIAQTLERMLETWDAMLDKARNYKRPEPAGSKGESVQDRNARLEMASALRAIAQVDELIKNL
jgi:hypothetical protein